MKIIDRRKLQKLFLIQGATQRDVAEAAGWGSHAYLGKLVRGEAETLKVEPACRIADYFGVGVDDLFLVQTSSESLHIAKRKAA